MADERDSRTEPATPRRRQEARESGQTSKSVDLTAAALLVAGLAVLLLTARRIMELLSAAMTGLLGGTLRGGSPADARAMFDEELRINGPLVARITVPIMLTVALTAVAVLVLQVGLHASAKPLMPSLSRLSPLRGLGRLFAGRNAMQLAMNFSKLVLVGTLAWLYVQGQLPAMLSLSAVAFPANLSLAAGLIFDLAWRLAWALLILAGLDWLYQKWCFERDIRMTKHEVKEEAKRMEGDQEIKGRRRQLARRMITQRIHAEVPRADVVITNPTELAIALRYDPQTMSAPRVVAKGAGYLAARIRQIAVQNGVPLVERKPLAQALYKTVEVGQEIPPQLYQAIAEILAYVYELAGKGARRLQRAG